MNPYSLLAQLTPNQREKLISLGTIKSYSPNQLIHSRGQIKPGLSVVIDGLVMVGIGGKDGSYVPVTVLGPGESFGEFTLFADLPRTHDIYAYSDARVLQVTKSKFERFYQHDRSAADSLLKITLLRTHQLLEMHDALSRLPLPLRAMKLLLSLAVTAGTIDHLTIRQSDISALMGVSRVSLGKVLQQLQEQQLIKLGYGKIEFGDRKRCEAWLASQTDTPLNA
ncbi:MAG: Crp/Fnr family transcriptional regulator [Kangiellaceae bacterium]|jgi:CRP-like cAMP-binding protein|nr:Crp/Fnr family transcriptional regulator [Kangiellaceae bacterium]